MAPLFGYRVRLAGFIGTGFLFGAGALYVHEWLVVPFFCNVFVWSYVLRQVRCAQCCLPLAPDVGSSFREVIGSFRSKECKACGAQLDTN